MPSIHSIVSTLWVVRSQSTAGTRKSGSSRVFSAISDSAAASSRRSISIATERDIVLMTSISRSRRASAECASALCATKKKSPRSRRKREATLGRSTLTATDLRTPSRSVSPRCTCAIEAAATGGPRLTNACATGRSSDAAIDGLGFGLRKRRQPVLQGFQIARHRDADHVGPGRQKLSELEIGRAEPRQRARQPRAGFGAGPFDQPRQPQRELSGRRHQTRIDDAEHAFAREHVSGADQPRDVGRRRNHKRQPECNATMPPERLSHFTREKPASRIISANALGRGNFRIDSTRY